MADQETESWPFPIFLALTVKCGNGFPRRYLVSLAVSKQQTMGSLL